MSLMNNIMNTVCVRAGMMPDLLHPDGDGYELLGQRFAAKAFGPSGLLLPGRCAASSL
jgi:hypothetical protein